MKWFNIKGFEGRYQINKNGQIKSLGHIRIDKNGVSKRYKEKLMLIHVGTHGYKFVHFENKKLVACKLIHRILAETFIPNPNNKPQVNHKNGIKTDNRIDNLEWCTPSENGIHASIMGLLNISDLTLSKLLERSCKLVLNTETGIYYDTAKEAAKSVGINYTTLSSYLCGNRPNKSSLIYV